MLETRPSFLPFFSLPLGPGGSRWRDYGALAIIMAGIAFGFHQLYKVSCLPRAAECCAPPPFGTQPSFLTPDLQRVCKSSVDALP